MWFEDPTISGPRVEFLLSPDLRWMPVSGFGFRVSGLGFRVSGLGFRVSGFGFRVSGLGFRGYPSLLVPRPFVPWTPGASNASRGSHP